DGIVELARRYFRGHGPAQIQDFVWWSGLTMADARYGLDLAGASLDHQVVDGRAYWFQADATAAPATETVAHVLPNFDEYTVAHRDRTAVLDPGHPFDPALFSFGSLLSNVLTVDGRVRGAWRRTTVLGGVRVDVRLIDRLERAQTIAIERSCLRLSRFLQRKVELRSSVEATT
ncbi:MAG: DNA glycosylase AlkZ-like family protein, partial [Chloroflexota bacterium]